MNLLIELWAQNKIYHLYQYISKTGVHIHLCWSPETCVSFFFFYTNATFLWSPEERTEMIPAASALFPPGQYNQAFHIINNKKNVSPQSFLSFLLLLSRRGELLHTSCKRLGGAMFWDGSVSVHTRAQLIHSVAMLYKFPLRLRTSHYKCAAYFSPSLRLERSPPRWDLPGCWISFWYKHQESLRSNFFLLFAGDAF